MEVEIHYFDKDDKACSRDEAVTVIIRELDDDGGLIKETFGIIEKKVEEKI